MGLHFFDLLKHVYGETGGFVWGESVVEVTVVMSLGGMVGEDGHSVISLEEVHWS